MFQGDIEEVAGAAGGVQYRKPGEANLEGTDQPDRLGVLALLVQREGGAMDAGPFLAERRDDGGDDQALDIGARGVVGAEPVTLARV